MIYRKNPVDFLISILGIIGLMTILPSCGTWSPQKYSTPTQTPESGGIQKEAALSRQWGKM
jgi:hypothetical protein